MFEKTFHSLSKSLLNYHTFLFSLINLLLILKMNIEMKLVVCNSFFMAALWIGQAMIFLPCDFYLLSSFFPRLISAAADSMSTILPHMVWP